MLRDTLWWAAYIAFGLWVAYSDFRMRRVPNHLLVIAAAAQGLWLLGFSLGGTLPSVGAQGWRDALPAFALGLCFAVCWKQRLMGAGDVKFLAVQGLLLGIKPWFAMLLLGSVLSGAHALMQVLSKRRGVAPRQRGGPYAAYLALAAIASVAFMPSNSPLCSWCSSVWSTRY
ncbi:MAG TPA: A24 family peptidase [Bordetella sp.]